MPLLSDWFDPPVSLDWEKAHESPWSSCTGSPYWTFPAAWLVPYCRVSVEDLRAAPTPLWITDVHPDSPVGMVNEHEEGTFIIDLPSSWDLYWEALPSATRKKFRATLRRADALSVDEGHQDDIDALWPQFCERLQQLAQEAGGEPYTNEEFALRRRLYRSPSVRILSMRMGGTLVGANVSLWEGDTVFDMACLLELSDETKRLSLGTVAILKNIELSIREGKRRYDLLSRDYGYKRQFGARGIPLKCIIVCDAQFAAQYAIPDGLYRESIDDFLGNA